MNRDDIDPEQTLKAALGLFEVQQKNLDMIVWIFAGFANAAREMGSPEADRFAQLHAGVANGARDSAQAAAVLKAIMIDLLTPTPPTPPARPKLTLVPGDRNEP